MAIKQRLVWRKESHDKLANWVLIPVGADVDTVDPEDIVAVIAPEMSRSNRWEITGREIILHGKRLGRVMFVREAKEVVDRELAKLNNAKP